MQRLSHGLQKPFLSLAGFTTPETFDELVDFHNATNGFIGRSILFNERETVPMRKQDFNKTPMQDTLRFALAGLYALGGNRVFAGLRQAGAELLNHLRRRAFDRRRHP